MRAADIAMYRAKARGGGQHCLFNDELAAEHQRKIDTEKALTEAVQRGEFMLAFQPQLSLVTGEIVGRRGAAALEPSARGPARCPDSFIPIAESTGLIAEIGDWVMAEVASMLGSWHREGLARRLAFNVSPRQLDRADFFARLRQAFADAAACRCRWSSSSSPRARRWKSSETVLAEIAALRAGRRDASRSTISAPAIRTSPGCARCRSTGSSSTRR